ncbi:MAG: hypothetical protein AAB370_09685 [Verrucomicrobiota bacterium]
MRTKSLVAAAALLAVGAASSMAQNNVYSLNVVGYVNVTAVPGFTMLNNPLVSPDNSVGTLLKDDQNGGTVPAGSVVYKFEGGTYVTIFNDEFGGGWDAGTITNGQGFFLLNNTASPATVTFVGEVPQGAVNNALVPGFNLVGSKVPQGGFLDDLGLTSTDGDIVYKFVAGSYNTYFKDEFGGGWSSSSLDFDPVKGPNLDVGAGMFYFRSDINGAATWNRNFTVQP